MIENTTSLEALKVLKKALTQKKTDADNMSYWEKICKELEMQTIFPLVADAVIDCLEKDSEKNKVISAVAENLMFFHLLMTAQSQLIDLLEAHHIPVVIMKGAAAAQYYPKPELRQMGDIDILVLPKDFEKTFHLLCEAGYQNENELDVPQQRHIAFWSKDGIEIELHRYFSSSQNDNQNTLLDHWLYDKLNEVKKAEVCCYEVPVFPALENGLILLGHINQHLTSGLGLRQIIDWYYYCNAELDNAFWKNEFKEKAKAIGMEKLAKVTTRMCQKYLGLSESITWCKDADEDLVDGLMEYVLKKGNFGRKRDFASNRTVAIFHRFTSISGLLRYLNEGGMINMQKAGLRPVKAVAWLYQIGHLARATLSRKGHVNIKEEMKKGMEEMELLKKLEVTRL